MKTVKDLVSPVTIELMASDPLSKLLRLMSENKQSCVVICDDGFPKGIVTERDIAREFADQMALQALEDIPIKQIMTPNPICVEEDTLIHDAVVLALSCKVRHLPVVDKQQKFIGMVTQNDTLKAFLSSLEANSRLQKDYEAAKLLSYEDPMLGVGNRRAMELDLNSSEANALRYKQPYSIAMVDIDYFKKYNDHYGHQNGDDTLIKVAHCIKQNLRGSDRVYRYGGEEFLVLIPGANAIQAEKLANRIRENIESLDIPHEPSPLKHVTISAGVAITTGKWSGAVKGADEALYEAKHSGRNRVCISSKVN